MARGEHRSSSSQVRFSEGSLPHELSGAGGHRGCSRSPSVAAAVAAECSGCSLMSSSSQNWLMVAPRSARSALTMARIHWSKIRAVSESCAQSSLSLSIAPPFLRMFHDTPAVAFRGHAPNAQRFAARFGVVSSTVALSGATFATLPFPPYSSARLIPIERRKRDGKQARGEHASQHGPALVFQTGRPDCGRGGADGRHAGRLRAAEPDRDGPDGQDEERERWPRRRPARSTTPTSSSLAAASVPVSLCRKLARLARICW